MYLQLEEINKLDFSNKSSLTQIATMVQSLFMTNHSYMTTLARVWDTNIRFFEGDQWIYYDNAKKTNMTIPILDGVNDFIPRPVTNLISPTLMTIASVFTKNKPTALVFPNSDQDADMQAARVAEAILDTKWDLDDEARLHVRGILIALLCGTVFRKDYWDPAASTTNIQPDGLEDDMPIGDTKAEMLTPFEVYPDIYGGNYYFEARCVPIETIRQMYDRQDKGYTGRANEVKPDRTYNSVLQYRENLRTLTPSGVSYGYGQAGGGNSSETAVLVECYIRPTRAFPKGIMVVQANGIPLYVADSPYYDKRVEDSWHPYTVFQWEKSPTRFHGISLCEKIVPLQRRLNGLDSFIMLNNMSMVNPVWLIDKMSNIPEGYLNGRPGLHVYFTGTPPTRLQGIGLPTDIYKERQQLVEDIHFIAGDNLVLHGEQPSGVNTATGLQLLLEQSAGKFSPYYTNWEKFIENGQQKKLLLIAKNYIQQRPDFLKKIKHFSRNSNTIDIKNFLGSDLRDNFTIRIEAGSSVPRSKLVEQQQLLDLAKLGMLGDVSPQANPVANQKFLEKFGVTQFQGITNPDLLKANFVVGVLKQINDNKLPENDYPPLLPFENVDIHMQTLVDEMKRPEFKDPKQVFAAKFEELNAAKEAQMQALQPVPIPQGQGFPQGAPQGGPQDDPNMPQPPDGQPPVTQEELSQLLSQGQ
ncbi:MAG: hypothetical protein SFW66_08830 [Gammaproteobacteria bacterium]|nr:hypothetical protein [Gammaproteobacteria bacterium]